MSDTKPEEHGERVTAESETGAQSPTTPVSPASSQQQLPTAASSSRASSITGVSASKLKAPTNFSGSTGSVSKIGRLCTHSAPKAGPPTRDTNSMSRESDDNLSSINSTYTDMYQKTVERFTRSSLSPEMDRYSPSRLSMKSSTPSYLKSDSDRHTSYHGAVLTADTEHFIIGQRVWVGGIRPGQIAYIGETHFAPGDWAGIVLDEPNGKNDGCVAGKRYFQCEPRKGIFSRLTRLTVVPLPGASIPTSPILKYSPERSRTVSPTASIRSSFLRSPGKNGLTVGDRIIVSSGFGSRPGILRYLGETQFASGNWCGVELDEASGKNDGAVDGIRYFECKPKYGVFVPIAKVSLSPSSKKTRLSRTGSRESLTSIGTMNSIATTNTSRMRMNAQRKPSLIKPVTTPKSQFSMQDLIREKQNHIEQLMIERDLDREDAQNQALQFQKNISELKSRVAQLEQHLENERKKAEELQISVDEATFCGDELDAQTQVYKEKIQDLERKLRAFPSDEAHSQRIEDPVTAPPSSDLLEALKTQIADLTSKLNEQRTSFDAQLNDVQYEEKRLQENIKFLQMENETLQKELVEKDESLEKFSLSESGIENLRRELVLLKEESEKERQLINADYLLKLEEKNAEVQKLKEELSVVKSSLVTLEGERTNVEDECSIMRTECKSRDDQLQHLNEQIAKLTSELSVQRAESATLDELLKTQQLGSVEGNTALEEKISEIAQLKAQIAALQQANGTSEANLQMAGEELKKLGELQKGFEEKLRLATSADEEKVAAMHKLEGAMEALKKQICATNSDNEKYLEELQRLKETNEHLKTAENQLRKELAEKESLYVTCKEDLEVFKKSTNELQSTLSNLQEQSEKSVLAKTEEIKGLTSEIAKLRDKASSLEGESTTIVQQLSAKIAELETHNAKVAENLKVAEVECRAQQEHLLKQENTLSENVAVLKSTQATLDSTVSALNKLKEDHEGASKKNNDLEEKLLSSEAKCVQLQLELGDLSRKYDTTSTKCDSLAVQNESLEGEILAARNTATDVQAKVTQLTEELQEKQKHFSEMQASSNDSRLKMESEIEELRQKLSNAATDYEELKQSLQKTKDELSQKNREFNETEEKRIKQELALSDAVRQQENLQAKYDALAVQNESLQGDLMALRSSSTDSNVELVKLTQEIARKQKEYEELQDKTTTVRSSLEGQLEASQQHVDALCKQVETLTQEIKAATEESSKRFELLKEEQRRSGKQELELNDVTRKWETLSNQCASLEQQNESLQKDLATLRAASTDSNAVVLKLSEELSIRQKAMQDLTDETNGKRLHLESQLQELNQNLQASRSECEDCRSELKLISQSKDSQAEEFELERESLKKHAQQELQEFEEKAAAERRKLIADFEAQLKIAENKKIQFDEAISSLQTQIKLLQDELLKSQLDFKSKEDDSAKQIRALCTDKESLNEKLLAIQSEGSATLGNVQQENSKLLQSVQKLENELRCKQEELQSASSEREQLKLLHANSNSDYLQLQSQLKTVEESFELSKIQLADKTQLLEGDKRKIEELKGMLEAMQISNANMSATNAELSAALQLLEEERCETANIFELFEMESDQNTGKLIEKMSHMKKQLSEAQGELVLKGTTLTENQEALANVNSELDTLKNTLEGLQSNALKTAAELSELQQANSELKEAIGEKEAQVQQCVEVERQLTEYKKIVDEMDDASSEKSTTLSQLQDRIKELEQQRVLATEIQKNLKFEYTNLQRKLEMLDLDKTREIVALQARIKDLHAIHKPKQNGSDSGGQGMDDNEDSTAHINFLNSIIADMQKKNDTLKAKIEALEALPTDFTQPRAFDILTKRKPMPRVFCDICDEFDKHETEDCPLQASDDRDYSPLPSALDPVNRKERKLPEPRKYCASCEVFGHETGECDDECF